MAKPSVQALQDRVQALQTENAALQRQVAELTWDKDDLRAWVLHGQRRKDRLSTVQTEWERGYLTGEQTILAELWTKISPPA